MQSTYYAVVRPDLTPPRALRTFHTCLEDADESRTDVREIVMKVTLTSVDVTPEERMERLEQEVRTLKTMVTALCGRVAEVSNAQAAK